MIKLLGTIPRSVTVACSGGVDSMVLLDFLKNKHKVKAAFFHHGTSTSTTALPVVEDYCYRNGIELYTGNITTTVIEKGLSPEEHWRKERYKFLDQFDCVVTGHHLDDVAETWIWSSLHGQSKLLPYRRGNVLRPLLITRKAELLDWADRKGVPYIEDKTNNDTAYIRNYVRHNLMEHALYVNPGLHTTLKRKLEEKYKKESTLCLTDK